MNKKPRVTAASLQKKCAYTGQVKSEIYDILNAMDQDINAAAENNQSCIEFSMPANFNIAGTTNSRAQLLIYNDVIENLESRGFTVRINQSSNIWVIRGWNIIVDSKLENELMNTIASRTQRKTA